MTKQSRLLEHLSQLGLLNEGERREVIAFQGRKDGSIVKILLEMGLIREVDLARGIASFFRYPFVDLTRIRVTKQALQQAAGDFCRRHKILPFGIDPKSRDLLVAIADPSTVTAIDALRFQSSCNVKPYVAATTQLSEAIEFYCQGTSGSLPSKPASTASAVGPTPPSTGANQRPNTDAQLQSRQPARPATGVGRKSPGRVPQRPISQSQPTPSSKEIRAGDARSSSPLAPPSTEEIPKMSLDSGPARNAPDKLASLNPYHAEELAKAGPEISSRLARLEKTLVRLDRALRYEMSISQALAEVLVENGLLSSEQLKSKLRKK